MATIAETWKQCRIIFGGTKYDGLMNPDAARFSTATAAQLAKFAEIYGDVATNPACCQVYVEGWGFKIMPCEWVLVHGQPVASPLAPQQQQARKPPPPPPSRKAPPPPPTKKKAPPPPPTKRAS